MKPILVEVHLEDRRRLDEQRHRQRDDHQAEEEDDQREEALKVGQPVPEEALPLLVIRPVGDDGDGEILHWMSSRGSRRSRLPKIGLMLLLLLIGSSLRRLLPT